MVSLAVGLLLDQYNTLSLLSILDHAMPVDKKVKERHQLLDELFRTPEGLKYTQIQESLSEHNIAVTVRTIQQDIAYFETHYNAKFKAGLRIGHSTLIRYCDITRSVLDKSGIAEKLLEVSKIIQSNNDLYPHYIFASSIIQHLLSGNSVDEFYNAVDFGSNINLTGIELFGDILKSIINKQCISFHYRPSCDEPLFVTVSPYRLKQYNQRWFLICKSIGSDLYSFDALDRIEGNILDSSAEFEEPDWNRLSGLQDTIGTYDALNEDVQPEDIILKVSKKRFPFIESKPFHWSQEQLESTTDSELIKLHIKVNRELTNTILYYGDDIEVLKPDHLRKNIGLISNNMAAKYAQSTK